MPDLRALGGAGHAVRAWDEEEGLEKGHGFPVIAPGTNRVEKEWHSQNVTREE